MYWDVLVVHVALYILGLVEIFEVEGVELYWTWIGKIMTLFC